MSKETQTQKEKSTCSLLFVDPRLEYLDVSIKLGVMKETIKVKMD